MPNTSQYNPTWCLCVQGGSCDRQHPWQCENCTTGRYSQVEREQMLRKEIPWGQCSGCRETGLSRGGSATG